MRISISSLLTKFGLYRGWGGIAFRGGTSTSFRREIVSLFGLYVDVDVDVDVSFCDYRRALPVAGYRWLALTGSCGLR